MSCCLLVASSNRARRMQPFVRAEWPGSAMTKWLGGRAASAMQREGTGAVTRHGMSWAILTRRTAVPARAATLLLPQESGAVGRRRPELWAGSKSWPASADLARAAVLSASDLVGRSRDAAAVGLSASLIGPLQCHLTTGCLKFSTLSGTLEISLSNPVVRVSRAAAPNPEREITTSISSMQPRLRNRRVVLRPLAAVVPPLPVTT